MQIDRRLVAHFDWTLLLLALALVAVGIVTIYSANNIAEAHAGALPARQLLWLGLGLIAMLLPWPSTIITSIGWRIRFMGRCSATPASG